MGNFSWQAEYSVGDATIDGQHRQMIAILNKLADLLDGREHDDTVTPRRLFDDLALYVTAHFAYEEQRMADAGYPLDQVAAHRREHRQLLQTLQSFERHVDSGDAAALAELMPFLYGDWLIHHICQVDKDYAGYLAGRPAGLSG